MASIPSDVIWDILFHMAVKDHLRFRCVSKSFHSLIDTPDFIKQHISHHSRKTNTNLYGISKYIDEFGNPKFVLLDLNNDNSSNPIPQVLLDPPPTHGGASMIRWELLGSCNGLVALRDSRKEITLWNPFTRKYKKVESSPYSNILAIFSYGFGYDPKTDDYKLVEILVSLRILSAAIYSLKTNSWKEVGGFMSLYSIYDVFRLNPSSVLANNVLHLGYEVCDDEKGILAFDLVKEEFRHVPVLDCFNFRSTVKLSVLDKCLTVTSTDGDHTYVWVMRDYGVKKSWTKLLSVSHSNIGSCKIQNVRRMIPLVYSRGRDKVLLSSSGQFFWYDLVKEKVETCLTVPYCNGDVNAFKGSLVTLNERINEHKRRKMNK